jgi:hypothetical protein
MSYSQVKSQTTVFIGRLFVDWIIDRFRSARDFLVLGYCKVYAFAVHLELLCLKEKERDIEFHPGRLWWAGLRGRTLCVAGKHVGLRGRAQLRRAVQVSPGDRSPGVSGRVLMRHDAAGLWALEAEL